MKITIQGHPTRGKEVIQILENLGGRNTSNHNGKDNYAYYISSIDNRIYKTSLLFSEHTHYTLEEFEKEFPFKIGDRVITITTNLRGIITNLKENGWYYVKCDNGHFVCIFGQHLKLYKEMERNITLTLDKAQEWYKKGGELREIALQAFTEKELNPLPRSWKEFCDNYPMKGGISYIDDTSNIKVISSCDNNDFRDKVADRNMCPSKRSAEAHLAMIQLEQLRNCWWNGWEPIWDISEKWCIRLWGNELSIGITTNISRFLTFPTKEMAEEFLKCFRDIIELAKNLI